MTYSEYRMNNTKRLFGYEELRDYCESIHMTECRVHYVDPYETYDPWSEDPHGQVFTVDALINFLMGDNLYEQGRNDLCHGLVMFNNNGYVEDVLVA